MKKLLSWILLVMGICVFLYPFISNYMFDHRVGGLVEAYNESASELDEKKYDEILSAARNYNDRLLETRVSLNDPFGKSQNGDDTYGSLLNISGNGIMCYIEIPSINVYLPVFHGTSEKTLQRGAGHLEGTSLPVGGINTHCVISAHTGIRDAKMFTDLDQLVRGDVFYLHTLDEILAYRVDQIKVVHPSKTEYLHIEKGKDMATLVTCTPYGINTHRLLVRGSRVDYEEAKSEIVVKHNGSKWMQEYLFAILSGIAGITGYYLIVHLRRKHHEVD